MPTTPRWRASLECRSCTVVERVVGLASLARTVHLYHASTTTQVVISLHCCSSVCFCHQHIMSSSLTEEPLDILAISSSAFGIFEVPRLHIEGMTSQKIIDHVTKIASAGGSSSAMVVHLDPQLTEMLHMLHCGERLKADLPAMLHHQVASLTVKCWMYLVWMRLIETDQAPVGAAIRDQILWSLMRPFESAHSTKATLSHRDNRHAKGKVKQGMKLVSLLLCHYPLLQKSVTSARTP